MPAEKLTDATEIMALMDQKLTAIAKIFNFISEDVDLESVVGDRIHQARIQNALIFIQLGIKNLMAAHGMVMENRLFDDTVGSLLDLLEGRLTPEGRDPS